MKHVKAVSYQQPELDSTRVPANTDRASMLWPLCVWGCNRLFIIAVSWLALSLLPMRPADNLWHAYSESNPVNGFVRWDSGWYAGIAKDGYIATTEIKDGEQRNTAFFPLYPLLIRWSSCIFGDIYASGLIVSNLAFLLALLLLYDSVRKEHGETCARRTTILLLFHPCSFFFSAMYTESLFLLLAILFFRSCSKPRLGYAGLCAAGAGLTRVVGIMFIPALMANCWRKCDSLRNCLRLATPHILIALAGAMSYLVFLTCKYGNPLEFAVAQNVEGWASGIAAIPKGPIDIFNLLFLPLAIYLLYQGRRVLKPEVLVWTTLTLLLSIARWPSMSRLSLVLYPLFVVAALKMQNRMVFSIVVAGSAVLLAITTARFALWYWVA